MFSAAQAFRTCGKRSSALEDLQSQLSSRYQLPRMMYEDDRETCPRIDSQLVTSAKILTSAGKGLPSY